jgi:hypothetical protein
MSGVIIPSRLYDNHPHAHIPSSRDKPNRNVTLSHKAQHPSFSPCGLRTADCLPHPCVLPGTSPRRALCYRCLKTGPSARLFPNVACGRVLVKVLQIPWIGFDPRSEALESPAQV